MKDFENPTVIELRDLQISHQFTWAEDEESYRVLKDLSGGIQEIKPCLETKLTRATSTRLSFMLIISDFISTTCTTKYYSRAD